MTDRRGRGAATEHLIADYFRHHGWPHATVKRGSGVDLENVAGLSVEIKARRDFLATLWLTQAAHRPGLPLVIWRPDGYGPTTLDHWPLMLRLTDGIALLRAAGYGDPTDHPDQRSVTP